MIAIDLSFGFIRFTGVEVEDLGDGLFRLEMDLGPFIDEEDSEFHEIPYYGDVFSAVPEGDGTYRFSGIVERSGFRRTMFTLPDGAAETAGLKAALDEVIGLGGYWEFQMENILFVHLPRDVPYDVGQAIGRAFRRA